MIRVVANADQLREALKDIKKMSVNRFFLFLSHESSIEARQPHLPKAFISGCRSSHDNALGGLCKTHNKSLCTKK